MGFGYNGKICFFGSLAMYSEEIVDAICANHLYEYLVVNASYEIVAYSAEVSRYCDIPLGEDTPCDLFCAVPELVGMERDLAMLFEGRGGTLSLPLVFKPPHYYVNLCVHQGDVSKTCIVLFENITENIHAKQQATQVHNDNLLLLDEIADKNRRLQLFSQKMQTLVEEEVAKNAEKQHMLELQTRHAQMGEMIALITHQWKQPLSVIQTVCANIKLKHEMGRLSLDLLMEKIDNIQRQTQQMSTTVSDFQKFFTPSKSKSRFLLNKSIRSLTGLVKSDFLHANILLKLEEKDEVWIEGYPNEYKQVILSILQNAKEAFLSNPSENMHIEIEISMKNRKSHVRISDNAGGIPLEILDKIFDQYQTGKTDGSGLGLYIAKSVIERNMGGKIWAKNSDVGAVFFVVV